MVQQFLIGFEILLVRARFAWQAVSFYKTAAVASRYAALDGLQMQLIGQEPLLIYSNVLQVAAIFLQTVLKNSRNSFCPFERIDRFLPQSCSDIAVGFRILLLTKSSFFHFPYTYIVISYRSEFIPILIK